MEKDMSEQGIVRTTMALSSLSGLSIINLIFCFEVSKYWRFQLSANDGANILESMDVDNNSEKLIVELSRNQDYELAIEPPGAIVVGERTG
ncbi:hypothetical protein HAX54_040166 [Datura stramonium]|uniref:Uncharacterized protein n=1 Tax=Datura stramonium TaxID=4076 RepID=A0ABS8SJT5_DATST|nr:hypothetical protein [Datura stramonium]